MPTKTTLKYTEPMSAEEEKMECNAFSLQFPVKAT